MISTSFRVRVKTEYRPDGGGARLSALQKRGFPARLERADVWLRRDRTGQQPKGKLLRVRGQAALTLGIAAWWVLAGCGMGDAMVSSSWAGEQRPETATASVTGQPPNSTSDLILAEDGTACGAIVVPPDAGKPARIIVKGMEFPFCPPAFIPLPNIPLPDMPFFGERRETGANRGSRSQSGGSLRYLCSLLLDADWLRIGWSAPSVPLRGKPNRG
jgi:hypothetical protein